MLHSIPASLRFGSAMSPSTSKSGQVCARLTMNVLRGRNGRPKVMSNTSERGEVTARANAKELETVWQSQKLVSRTKQLAATKNAKTQVKSARTLRGRSRGRTA
jgi:hypothetical protein